jgi:hypothetical protein
MHHEEEWSASCPFGEACKHIMTCTRQGADLRANLLACIRNERDKLIAGTSKHGKYIFTDAYCTCRGYSDSDAGRHHGPHCRQWSLEELEALTEAELLALFVDGRRIHLLTIQEMRDEHLKGKAEDEYPAAIAEMERRGHARPVNPLVAAARAEAESARAEAESARAKAKLFFENQNMFQNSRDEVLQELAAAHADLADLHAVNMDLISRPPAVVPVPVTFDEYGNPLPLMHPGTGMYPQPPMHSFTGMYPQPPMDPVDEYGNPLPSYHPHYPAPGFEGQF